MWTRGWTDGQSSKNGSVSDGANEGVRVGLTLRWTHPVAAWPQDAEWDFRNQYVRNVVTSTSQKKMRPHHSEGLFDKMFVRAPAPFS